MIVVDTSVGVDFALGRLDGPPAELVDPEVTVVASRHYHLEVGHLFRRKVNGGALSLDDATELVELVWALPRAVIELTGTDVRRAWMLTESLSWGDAVHVALAERLAYVLWTTDGALARNNHLPCSVRVLETT